MRVVLRYEELEDKIKELVSRDNYPDIDVTKVRVTEAMGDEIIEIIKDAAKGDVFDSVNLTEAFESLDGTSTNAIVSKVIGAFVVAKAEAMTSDLKDSKLSIGSNSKELFILNN